LPWLKNYLAKLNWSDPRQLPATTSLKFLLTQSSNISWSDRFIWNPLTSGFEA